MAVSTINRSVPKWEYVGGANQIHWSQWECPADGIIVFDFSLQTGGGAWYYYLRDVTLNIFAGKASGTSANGTSRTMTFPVLNGTAECWGRWAQHFGAFSANGTFYESGYTAKNYPSGLFTATPTLQYTFDECLANLIPVAYNYGSAVVTPQLWALAGKALTEANTTIVLRAIGKWR